MSKQRIAIIGLGRIGSAFLQEMLGRAGTAIELVCVAEKMDTPGKAQAMAAGLKLVSAEAVVAMGDEIDVIFDLTGNPDIRRELREQLAASGNRHTVIAPESILHILWTLMSAPPLPVIEGRKTGY